MNTATPMGADYDDDGFDPVEAFVRRLKAEDADKPSDEGDNDEEDNTSDEDTDDTDEPSDDTDADEPSDDEEVDNESKEDDGETDDEDDQSDDDEKPVDKKGKKPTYINSDDAVVKIKVDGKEVEAPLKDLKRLYGQEASLTRKSQEAADLKRRSEETGAKHVAGIDALLQRARAAATPYANINFLALTKDPDVSPEEIAALSDAANKAFDNVRFLETELDNVVKGAQEQRQQMLRQQAVEAVKVLSDPKTGIPGWNEALYNEIRSFAVSNGLDQNVVNELVDPGVFKLLHMALQYTKGQKALKDTKTKKVDKTPKRITKGTPDVVVQKTKTNTKDDALKRLSKSGSMDDAADAFFARIS